MSNYIRDMQEKQAYAQQGQAGNITIRPPSLKENLESQLTRATEEVSRLQELLKLLEDNPALSRAFELLGRNY